MDRAKQFHRLWWYGDRYSGRHLYHNGYQSRQWLYGHGQHNGDVECHAACRCSGCADYGYADLFKSNCHPDGYLYDHRGELCLVGAQRLYCDRESSNNRGTSRYLYPDSHRSHEWLYDYCARNDQHELCSTGRRHSHQFRSPQLWEYECDTYGQLDYRWCYFQLDGAE